MNKINRKVEYALIGLKHMRSKVPGARTTVKEISSLYGCPFEVTSRVMQVLAQKGLLRSEQGAHGGYMIAKDLNRVSFFDLTEMLLGQVAVAKCISTNSTSSAANSASASESGHAASGSQSSGAIDSHDGCDMRGTCNIVSPVQTLNRKLIDFYKSLTLTEILDPRSASHARAVFSAGTEVPERV